MSVLTAATALVLSLSVLLGGATRQGYLSDVIVQIAACVLVGLALWALSEPGRKLRFGRLDKALLGLVGLLCFVQVLPFFPGLGVKVLSIPEVAGGTLVVSHSWWSRVSLTPAATWAGLTSAVVPVAVFLAVTQCDSIGRVFLWRVVLVLGGVALLLGVLQMMQGPDSSLRFFAVTNSSEAVGFFANRNHFAAQLYVTLAFFGAWVATTGRHLLQRGGIRGRSALVMGGGLAFLLLLVAGLAMTRSRTGMLIAMGTVLGIGAMTVLSSVKAREGHSRRGGVRPVLLVLGFVVLIVVLLGLDQIVGRFQTDVVDNLRWHLSWVTLRTAFSTLPFGTGIGSFVPVYGAIEDPAHVLREYVNRAHNDLAEFLLEAGILGAAIVVLFLMWFWRHAAPVWTQAQNAQDDLYLTLQRAATLAIAGLLLHALLDYGLRTTALSALFAFSCGLLTRPQPAQASVRPAAKASKRKAPASRPLAPVAAVSPIPPKLEPQLPPAAWEGNVSWPEEWKSAGKPSSDTPRGRL